jgi:hypothetical protein
MARSVRRQRQKEAKKEQRQRQVSNGHGSQRKQIKGMENRRMRGKESEMMEV